MKWTTAHGKLVQLEDDHVVVRDPHSSISRIHRARAFARPRALWVRDMGVLASVLKALADKVPPHELPDPLACRRQTFWRAIDPDIRQHTTLSFVEHRSGRVWPVQLEITGLVVTRISDDSMGYAQEMLLDDAFFHGPHAFGVGAQIRDRLCELVLAKLPANAGITPHDAFPIMDYEALPQRSWCFDERANGESYVMVEGHTVTAGHQYERDMGYDQYPVERVLTCADNVKLGAPLPMQEEVLAYLRTASRSATPATDA